VITDKSRLEDPQFVNRKRPARNRHRADGWLGGSIFEARGMTNPLSAGFSDSAVPELRDMCCATACGGFLTHIMIDRSQKKAPFFGGLLSLRRID
jgi:hypothetical protein